MDKRGHLIQLDEGQELPTGYSLVPAALEEAAAEELGVK